MDKATATQEASRQRLAAIRARRSGGTWVTMECTAAEVQAGDFIIEVPTQNGMRGTKYECLLSNVRPATQADHVRTGGGRVRAYVGDIIFFTADSRYASLLFAPTTRVVLRRRVAA